MASMVEGFGNQVWLVRGYDGLRPIFETRIPQARLTVERAQDLLRCLACHDLTGPEITAAFLGDTPLLEVTADTTNGNRLAWSVGSNPHYIAALFRTDELPARPLWPSGGSATMAPRPASLPQGTTSSG
jgi:hypothetical protein